MVVILAGGQSRRMAGVDKAQVTIGGVRMIDILINRFQPLSGTLMISGSDDRGTGLALIPDDPDGPKGPASALWSVWRWCRDHGPNLDRFYTMPVDTPFLPASLVDELSGSGTTAIAQDDTGLHPTIGCWRLSDLDAAFGEHQGDSNPSLHSIASRCKAQHVRFESAVLFNINSQDDLKQAERSMLNAQNS